MAQLVADQSRIVIDGNIQILRDEAVVRMVEHPLDSVLGEGHVHAAPGIGRKLVCLRIIGAHPLAQGGNVLDVHRAHLRIDGDRPAEVDAVSALFQHQAARLVRIAAVGGLRVIVHVKFAFIVDHARRAASVAEQAAGGAVERNALHGPGFSVLRGGHIDLVPVGVGAVVQAVLQRGEVHVVGAVHLDHARIAAVADLLVVALELARRIDELVARGIVHDDALGLAPAAVQIGRLDIVDVVAGVALGQASAVPQLPLAVRTVVEAAGRVGPPLGVEYVAQIFALHAVARHGRIARDCGRGCAGLDEVQTVGDGHVGGLILRDVLEPEKFHPVARQIGLQLHADVVPHAAFAAVLVDLHRIGADVLQVQAVPNRTAVRG